MAKRKVVHNKLVRDNIPEYLEGLEIGSEIEKIDDQIRYHRLLLDKLVEEADEASLTFEDRDLLEELGDIESVVDGILKAKGWTRAELKMIQDKKDAERGKFDQKIFLISTSEEIEEETEEESDEE